MAGRFTTACATRLLPLLLLLMLPAAVQAQSYTNTYGIWGYTTTNGTITITGYTGPGGDVTIPDRIPDTTNGLPVTSIGANAFSDCTSLANVTIPNSVTSIGAQAFYYCTSLTSVTIPNSVTNIGGGAFFVCSSLTSVTIPNSVTSIGIHTFAQCTSLTSVKIPNSVTSIEGGAFAICTSLTSVTIPNSVTYIGDSGLVWSGAFFACTSLTSVTIGNGVTYIGANAFHGCTGLTSVTIPNNVTHIGGLAFYGCDSLTAITVDAPNPAYCSVDGVLFDKSQTTLIEYPGGKAGAYTIPNSVTNIEGAAFESCANLTSVTICSSVTSIGDNAFESCFSLAGVYFQGNVPSLGFEVFFDSYATVYYLPGTTGWNPTFGGLPTVLWNPQVQTTDGGFGVRTNQFGFNINWASGMTVVVEANTNLADPTWTPVATNTPTSGSAYFNDPQWTNYPGRFYRLRWP